VSSTLFLSFFILLLSGFTLSFPFGSSLYSSHPK
jgi:hypothetical protein